MVGTVEAGDMEDTVEDMADGADGTVEDGEDMAEDMADSTTVN
jgi:hypothetical protein